jgi:alpha-ketoglutarate-dependent taurine dioxygenase
MGQHQNKFGTCEVTVDNDDASLISIIDNLTYDYRVCYRFKWEVGDLHVSDKLSMLHTRTGYSSNCDREIWRIHCD